MYVHDVVGGDAVYVRLVAEVAKVDAVLLSYLAEEFIGCWLLLALRIQHEDTVVLAGAIEVDCAFHLCFVLASASFASSGAFLVVSSQWRRIWLAPVKVL